MGVVTVTLGAFFLIYGQQSKVLASDLKVPELILPTAGEDFDVDLELKPEFTKSFKQAKIFKEKKKSFTPAE
ncbi:hypothetical protein D3C85_1801900 [compost metagenome]